MLQQISVEGLGTNKLSDAWVLARSSGAYPNEDWWIAEGSDIIARGGGVLAARAADATLHGIATFHGPTQQNGDRLVVSMLLTFELSPSAPARTALLDCLERIATKLNCTEVLLPLRGKREIAGRRRSSIASD